MVDRSQLDIILKVTKDGKGDVQVEAGLKGVDKQTDKTGKSTDKLTKSWKALNVTMVAVTVGALLKGGLALAEQAIQAERAEMALEAYTGSAEEAARLTQAVVDATDGAISNFTAAQSAARLLSMGLAENAEEAAELTSIATTLGATMGKDAKGAFEEFSLLLANQSIQRLDTFGISAGRVRARMQELAQEFPNMDREARFMNATLEIANEKMEVLAESGFEAFSELDKLKATVENLGVELGTGLKPGLEEASELFNNLLKPLLFILTAENDITEAVQRGVISRKDANRLITDAILTSKTYGDVLDEVNQREEANVELNERIALSTRDMTTAIEDNTDAVDENAKLAELLKVSLSGVVGTGQERIVEAIQSMDELKEEQQELNQEFSKGKISFEQYQSSMEKLEDKQDALTEKINDTKEALREQTAQLIFSQASAGLDAKTSLLLARELGLVDEQTFEVARRTQELRGEFDEGAISAEEFAEGVGILNDAIGGLTDKSIEVTVDTVQAELDLLNLRGKIDEAIAPILGVVSLPEVPTAPPPRQAALPGFQPFTGFQDGGQFQIPGMGRGDRVPVSFMGEPGETVTVTPRAEPPPSSENISGGSGGDVNISVNLSDSVTLDLFMERLKDELS
jgi:chromosome segregation ATPase